MGVGDRSCGGFVRYVCWILVILVAASAILALGERYGLIRVCGWFEPRELALLPRSLDVAGHLCVGVSILTESPGTGPRRVLPDKTVDLSEPNRLNEYFYNVLTAQTGILVTDWPAPFLGDTDKDGRPELCDAWGNPLAIIWGKTGAGAVYRLRDGTVAELKAMRVQVPKHWELEKYPRKRRLGFASVYATKRQCTWAFDGKVRVVTYEKEWLASRPILSQPFVVFSIRGGPGAPKGYISGAD